MSKAIEVTMHKDKVTPNTVRYTDGADQHSKNIYLTKTEVKELGDPENITVTINAA